MEQIKVFISYAHDDDAYFKDFTIRLKKAAQNTEHFNWHLWDDRGLHIGTFWDEEIQKNIQDCNVALLLVSMSFMASKYIKENEFETFKKLYAEKGILIAPIIFAPCDFQRWEDLGKIQFFKPKGSDYGKSEVEHFTYADLLNFKSDGTILPAPNADRYILNLVKEIEHSFNFFLEEQKKDSEKIIVDIPISVTTNNLLDAPKPRSYFTGRDKEIVDFKTAIDTGVTLIAIDGPGGIGKTQFISQCIEKFVPAEKIIWYECTAVSHLDTLISEAGYPELLKGNNKTDREKFSAFKDKIQKNELFLFLDNFQETNNNPAFREFLVFIQNYLKKGCVVVMDRDDLRASDLTPKRIHIEGFKEKQLEYAKALIEHSYKDDVNISDHELKNLCEQLLGYPLIIDLAILLLSQGETSKNIITKIVQQGDNEKVSERLLNAIFSRPDASEEEKDFITEFSIFNGRVPENDVKAIIPYTLLTGARRKLQQKNLISYFDGYYEIHPLVRAFCYKRLVNKEISHAKVADYYIGQRTGILSPALEEQIFYHLFQSKQWERIDSEIEENGRKFILQGQLGLVKDFVDRLIKIGLDKPIFSILSGDIAEIQGRLDEAQAFFDVARHNDTDKKIQIKGIIKYADILFRKGSTDEALQLYQNAYNLTGNDFLMERAFCATSIGLAYDLFGNKKIATEYLDEALILQRKINDKEGIASCLVYIGRIFNAKGEYDTALKNFKEAFDMFVSINDKIGISNSLLNIGNAFLDKKKYDEAINYYEESLRISEEIGYRLGIADALGKIGSLYRRLNQLDEALRKYEESKKIVEEVGNKQAIAATLNNIALVFRQLNNFNNAIILYKQSLEMAEKIHDMSGVASTYLNLGDIYISAPINEYSSAIVCFFKSAAINNKIGFKSKFVQAMTWIVDVREKIGLQNFKAFAIKAFQELDPDLQKYLPLKELLKEPLISTEPKIGRNDPCPCGSGKKYKQCHAKQV